MEYVNVWNKCESVRIFGIADVHIGSAQSRFTQLKEFLKNLTENDLVVFLGDVIDNAIIDSVSDIYEQTMNPEQALYAFTQILDICKDKVIGVISGNHEERTRRRVGVDLLSVVCRERKIAYSQDILVLDIAVGDGVARGSRRRVQYTLVCGHGYSSARGIGAKVTASGRIIDVVTNGDVYLTAHTHQPGVVKIARFEADTRNKKLQQREAFLITVPSWVGYETYAAQKFMHPTAGGYVEVLLSGKEKKIEVVIR